MDGAFKRRRAVRNVGDVLHERFVIEGVLGVGGMGAVYLARHRVLQDRLVAIKEMTVQHRDPAKLAGAISQFEREAQMLAGLDHPNLVKVRDYFQDGAVQFLVMDYIEGRTLDDMIPSPPRFIEEATVLDWTRQVCDVLTYLHTRTPPIIFRDLKPSNIMLTSEGHICLIDFGIAKTLAPDQRTATAIHGAGSIGYAPPEQHFGASDVRSDIYGLGATLYALLTSEPPPLSVVRQAEDTLVPPRQFNPNISPWVEFAILHMLQIKADARPQTAAAAWEELSRAQSGPPPPPLPLPQKVTPGQVPTTPMIPARKAPVGQLAAVVVVAGLAAWGLVHPFSAAPATAHLASNPEGAQVVLDGLLVGQTPLDLPVPSRSVKIELRKAGYQDFEQVTMLQPSQPLSFVLTPVPRKWLVTVNPSSAQVSLNGSAWQPAGTSIDVGSGPCQVNIEAPGYKPLVVNTTFPPDTNPQPHLFALQPLPANVAVEAVPGATFTVNGEKHKDRLVLTKPGEYMVQISAPGFRSAYEKVVVAPNETASHVIAMAANPTQAPQPTPSPAQTVVMLPPGQPTPVAVPSPQASSDSLVVPGVRVGAMQVGAPAQPWIDRLHMTKTPVEGIVGDCYDGGGVRLYIYNSTINQIMVLPSSGLSYRTSDGVGFASSLEEVERVYGKDAEVMPTRGQRSMRHRFHKLGLEFDVGARQGRVIAIGVFRPGR